MDFVFIIVCFTSHSIFGIAFLSHCPGGAYYHLLLGR